MNSHFQRTRPRHRDGAADRPALDDPDREQHDRGEDAQREELEGEITGGVVERTSRRSVRRTAGRHRVHDH